MQNIVWIQFSEIYEDLDKGDIEDKLSCLDIQKHTVSIKTDIFATFWAQRQAQEQAAAQCWAEVGKVLEQLWGDTPRPRAEKPQQDGRKGKITF